MATKAFANTNYPTSRQIRDEITRLLKELAKPVEPGELPKACIRRASMRTGLPYGATRRLWYGLVKDPKATVTDRIRQKAQEHERRNNQLLFKCIAEMQASGDPLFQQRLNEASELFLVDRPAADKARSMA
jgi:hypothetical protein